MAGARAHQCEPWQLDDSANGGRYCRACGAATDPPLPVTALQPGQVVRLIKSPGTRGVAWGTPRADGLQRVSWSDGEMRHHRLDELRGDWRPAEIDAFRRDSIVVACPLCGAEPGKPCTYRAGTYDMETGESLRRLGTFARAPHHERVAVFTGGDLFGYTLRRLEQGR